MAGAAVFGEIPRELFGDSFHFACGEIYVRGKPLIEPSTDPAKLSSNMEVLKAAKEFVFYTTSGGEGHYLNTIVSKKATFPFWMKAIFINYELDLFLYDCELVGSFVLETPFGTPQSYGVRFKSAVIKTVAPSSGRVQRRGIGPMIPAPLFLPGMLTGGINDF